MSAPMPNPFDLNSGVLVPEAPGSAAACDSPPLSAAAETNSDTDCISEIFHYARKLMKQPPTFVLDEAAFMAEVEEVPLFLRQTA